MAKNNDFQTTLKERISYPLFSIGQAITYFFITGYLMLYFTNHIYLSNIVVAQILLFSKVWDAVNDPLFGLVVDRVQFKKYKFKPWLRISTPLIPITTLLMFQIPTGVSDSTKAILAVLFYFLWDLVYTISDVPVYSMVTTMTSNIKERSTLISYGSVAGIVNILIIALVFVPMIDSVGFGKIGIIIAVISFLGMLPLTITAKERVRENIEQQEKASIRDLFLYLRTNKYLLFFFLFHCINGMFAIGLGNYVFIELLGDLKYLTIFVAIGALPTLILFLLIPKITARVDKMKFFRTGVIISAALGVLLYFIGYNNIVLFGALTIIRTVIATGSGMLTFTFAMDCVEYGHYKTGFRKEGITFSIQTFSNKFVSAVSSSFTALVLEFIKYNGKTEGFQTAATLSGLWKASVWIPILGTCIALPFLFLYKLRSKDVQVMADINTGKISREEGEALFSRPY